MTGGDEDSDDSDGTASSDADYTILPAVSFVQPSTQDDTPATPPDDIAAKGLSSYSLWFYYLFML